MLSDEERSSCRAGIELAPTTRQTLLEEQFVMYQMVTRASESYIFHARLQMKKERRYLRLTLLRK